MNKNKYKDYTIDIINCKNDDEKKIKLCYNQLEYFHNLEKDSDFDFNNFLNIIEKFAKNENIEYKKIWLLLINQIIQFSKTIKDKYFFKALSLIFNPNFTDKNNPSEIEKIKLNTISNFTDHCTNLIDNEDVNKKILYFLIFNSYLKSESFETLNLIKNFLQNYDYNLISNYLIDYILECVTLYTINNYSLLIEMKNLVENDKELSIFNEDIFFKINESIELIKYYIFNENLIHKNYIITNIFIIILFQINFDENSVIDIIKSFEQNFLNLFKQNVINILNAINNISLINSDPQYYLNSYKFFIYDFFKKSHEIEIINDKQNQIFNLNDKIIKNEKIFINGILIVLKYLLIHIFKKNDFESEIYMNEILEKIQYIYKEKKNIDKSNIINFLDWIIKNLNNYLNEEYKIILDILYDYYSKTYDKKNYEYIMSELLYLKLNDKIIGYDNEINLLINLSANYNNNLLNSYQLFNLLNSNKKFEENINSICQNIFIEYINKKIDNSKIEIYNYKLNYIIHFFTINSINENSFIENLILDNFINFFDVFSYFSNLMNCWKNLIIYNLNNTNNEEFFTYIIQYVIPLINDNNKNLFFENFFLILIHKLNLTNQIKKLQIIFDSIFNYINFNYQSDEIFLTYFMNLLNSAYISEYGEIMNKRDATSNSSIIIKNDKTGNDFFFILDNEFIYIFCINKLNNNNYSIEFKENIINVLYNQSESIYFFSNLDISLIIEFIINIDENNFIQFLNESLIIDKSIKLLNNLVVFLVNDSLYKFKIIEYAIKNITYFNKLCQSNKNEIDNNKKKKNNEKDIKFNPFQYLISYYNLLTIYICNLYEIYNNAKIDFNKKQLNKNFVKINLIYKQFINNNKFFEFAENIINNLIETSKISSKTIKLYIIILKFLYFTKHFFVYCGEEFLIKIFNFLLNLSFPDYINEWDSLLNSKFKFKTKITTKKMKNYQNLNNKENENIFKQILNFSKILLIKYMKQSLYSMILFEIIYKVLKKIVKNKYTIFLLICEWNILNKGNNRQDNFIEIKDEILNDYMDNLKIITKLKNNFILRTPISYKFTNLENNKFDDFNSFMSLIHYSDINPNKKTPNKNNKEITKDIIRKNIDSIDKIPLYEDLFLYVLYIPNDKKQLSKSYIINYKHTENKKFLDFMNSLGTLNNSSYKYINSFHILNYIILNKNSDLIINFKNKKDNKFIILYFNNNYNIDNILNIISQLIKNLNIVIYLCIFPISQNKYLIKIYFNEKNKHYSPEVLNDIKHCIFTFFNTAFIFNNDINNKLFAKIIHKISILLNIILIFNENQSYNIFKKYLDRYEIFSLLNDN